ncbi:hypothetical protein RRG08_052775 [Elysia crispata]|uniref:Uncharacterized protein n=1 Tax=Elysia crispata TaxID=231223 RepID=A0AAE1B6D0_9GAST|nr:hypothetical protein RRG08_052775 [Elysia crispata]
MKKKNGSCHISIDLLQSHRYVYPASIFSPAKSAKREYFLNLDLARAVARSDDLITRPTKYVGGTIQVESLCYHRELESVNLIRSRDILRDGFRRNDMKIIKAVII